MNSIRDDVFLECDMDSVEELPFLTGRAAVFSARSPMKETPNEDAAALLRLDDRSGVIMVCDGVGGIPAGEQAARMAILQLPRIFFEPSS
jgi:serine/threonine protein phosphatase PrpC